MMSSINKSYINSYVSCMRINGVPILPPLITNEERQSLLKYKLDAVAIENKLKLSSKNKTIHLKIQAHKGTSSVVSSLSNVKEFSIQKNLVGRTISSSPCRSPKCYKSKQTSRNSSAAYPVQNDFISKIPILDMANVSAPRRQTVRRNSYTLESPTPEILEHLCALQNKNDQRLHLDPQEVSADSTVLPSSSFSNIEKQQCLKNLNQMNLHSESSCQYQGEKTFLENLPKNFFEVNKNVLSHSRNDFCENKLNSSIQLATDLLNSINTTECLIPLEKGAASSLHRPVANTFHSREQDARTDAYSLTIPDLAVNKGSDFPVPQHRHRRAWNLKQAKRLWENEELLIPESHSEPTSNRNSPLLACNRTLSCSLNWLQDYELEHEIYRPSSVRPATEENLQKPVACLERSRDIQSTSNEEDLNLYSYYLSLFKDMSEYVSQHGELLSPHQEPDSLASSEDHQISTQCSLEGTLKSSNGTTLLNNIRDVNNSSFKDERVDGHVESHIRSRDETISHLNFMLNNSLQYPSGPSDEEFDLEIPDNLDDIEQFLRDLQRSQEEEMALLLRKQQKEQLWLKQRQQRLKQSVLSVSSRSSSLQSSFNCSELSSLNDTAIHNVEPASSIMHGAKNIEGNEEEHGENEQGQKTETLQLVSNKLLESKIGIPSVESSTSLDSELNRLNNLPVTGVASNKSTPSQHNDSCDEWFTPEADKLSPMTENDLDLEVATRFERNTPLARDRDTTQGCERYLNIAHSENSNNIKSHHNSSLNFESDESLSESPTSQLEQETTSVSRSKLAPGETNISNIFAKEEDMLSLFGGDTQYGCNPYMSMHNKSTGVLKDILNVVQNSDAFQKTVGFRDSQQSSNEDMFRKHQKETNKIQQDIKYVSEKPLNTQLKSGVTSLEHKGESSDKNWDQRLRESENQQRIHEGIVANNDCEEAIELSPEIRTKLLAMMGKDWQDAINTEARHQSGEKEALLLDLTSQSTGMISQMSSTSIPVDPQNLSSNEDLQSIKSLQSITLVDNHSKRSEQPREEPNLISVENTSLASGAHISIDAIKQRYLLTPNVKRTQGLHEFENNVISRLHREANSRPKTIIKQCYSEREKQAAVTLTAAGRGFLVRRLLRTQRVQHIKDTIQDTLQCAMSLQADPSNLSAMDLQLHTRLIQQLTAACYELYDTFFSLSTREKLNIIALDRERLRNLKLALMLKGDKRPSLPSISALARTKRSQLKTMSEPKNSTNSEAVKMDKKPVKNVGGRVRRSKSVSSHDVASSRSSESASSTSGHRMSRSQSNTLDSKAHPVPIRRRLLLT